MVKIETLAKWEGRLRPLLTKLPPRQVVKLYSEKRLDFLARLASESPPESYVPPKELERVLWGIKFRGPLMNAAGMFKNGECYPLVAHEGAAAYMGGTGTWNAQAGFEKDGIHLPFVPYPRSHAASNKLALPNGGDEVNSSRAKSMKRINGCPVIWSVMGSPDYEGEERLEKLVESMKLYEKSGADGGELNESCLNTKHGRPQDDDLAKRLKYIKENFLIQRTRRFSMVVKFSNDTQPEQVRPLMDLLFENGFDGVNFGNTSGNNPANYARRREMIDPSEQALYDFFTTDLRFGVGGGVSGRPLKLDSLLLCATAVQYLRAGPPSQEFHVIRTGGIENAHDLIQSDNEGVSLNQWFTGRWEAFARDGYDSYRKVHEEYLALKKAA